MGGARDRLPTEDLARPSAHPSRTRPHVAALSLQRAAGNTLTQRILARRAARTTPHFRLLLVNDGDTGLSDVLVAEAVKHVRKEIARITKDSADDLVKAGFDVQHLKSKPQPSDIGRRLGRDTFVIFITRSRDADHAIALAGEYMSMDDEARAAHKKNFAKGIIAEGGVDLQAVYGRRRTESVGFVGSAWPLKELEKPGGGEASAAAVLADVVLHELGHALSHNTVMSDIDHDATGIMTKTLVLASGPHETRRFSTKSAGIVRGRLEELAQKAAR
jgi:hypothetical protein